VKRNKLNLDIIWLKDESLEDSANLPDPDITPLLISGYEQNGPGRLSHPVAFGAN